MSHLVLAKAAQEVIFHVYSLWIMAVSNYPLHPNAILSDDLCLVHLLNYFRIIAQDEQTKTNESKDTTVSLFVLLHRIQAHIHPLTPWLFTLPGGFFRTRTLNIWSSSC